MVTGSSDLPLLQLLSGTVNSFLTVSEYALLWIRDGPHISHFDVVQDNDKIAYKVNRISTFIHTKRLGKQKKQLITNVANFRNDIISKQHLPYVM